MAIYLPLSLSFGTRSCYASIPARHIPISFKAAVWDQDAHPPRWNVALEWASPAVKRRRRAQSDRQYKSNWSRLAVWTCAFTMLNPSKRTMTDKQQAYSDDLSADVSLEGYQDTAPLMRQCSDEEEADWQRWHSTWHSFREQHDKTYLRLGRLWTRSVSHNSCCGVSLWLLTLVGC